MFKSAIDERGESVDAPAKELTDELNDGAVRGGRRGRTLVNLIEYIERIKGLSMSTIYILLLVIQ